MALAREPVRINSAYLGVIDCDSVAEWRHNAFLACHSTGDALPISGDHAKRPDAYVLRVDLASAKLVYAVRLGGSGYSAAFAIRTDNDGNAYVAGSTQAADFPTTPDAAQPKFRGGKSDAFVAVISAEGEALYSSFLGGSGEDEGAALDRGAGGLVLVGGTTWSADFPGAAKSSPFSNPRAFLSRIDIRGAAKLKSVLLGGNGDMWLSGVKADGKGGVYVVGITHAADFPTLRSLQDHLRGKSDAFLSRLDVATLKMTFSTYFGGSGEDGAWGVAITASGDPVIAGFTDSADARSVWVVGFTASGDLPVGNAPEIPKQAQAQHAFIAAFTPSLEKLCFSAYPGDGEEGALEGVTLTRDRTVLASGFSYSTHVQRGIIDNRSGVSFRLNGRPVHAVLIEADVRSACR